MALNIPACSSRRFPPCAGGTAAWSTILFSATDDFQRACQFCTCVRDTICSVRRCRRGDAAAASRVVRRDGYLAGQPGDRFWRYPIDTNTILWGFAIGAGAFAATTASVGALRTLPQNRTPLVLVLTLLCAYGAYEFALFAVTPFLGGAGAFTATIIARLGFLNAAWLMGLVAACESIRLLNPFRRGRAVST